MKRLLITHWWMAYALVNEPFILFCNYIKYSTEELRPGGLATFAGYVKRGGQKKLVEELRPGGRSGSNYGIA